ncbi:MAG: hypothetical protein ABJ239_07155 [Erythrobacter sp.]
MIVYNAESGIITALLHALHKQFKPKTYPCSLCALTYGWVSMRSRWRKFLATLPVEPVFHHSDDFAEAYPKVDVALPAILIRPAGEQPTVLITAAQLDAMSGIEELISEVERRVVRAFASA